ncbi:MAG: agmatine deiminase [Gammaproteobacteria bacterium]
MNEPLTSTPLADGFRMPAEFEPHRGCWMLWPTRPDNWREQARPAQRAFAAVAHAIARFEPVSVGVSEVQFDEARRSLEPRIRVVRLESDDAWMRDVGPTCVVGPQGQVRGIDWHFNAWGGLDGGLYLPWDRDELVARRVLALESLARYRAPIVCEGGAIHSDGQGTLLVTKECLLNRNRNPTLNAHQIETVLRAYTGASTILWLDRGVFNDETDGHIDNLACFVAPGEVALLWCDDRRDPQAAISRDAFDRLSEARDTRGRRLKIHKIPMPGPLEMTDIEAAGLVTRPGTKPRKGGERLAASYVNFYIANGGVVVPMLDQRLDAKVIVQLQGIFPNRRVVGVPAREILLGGGNIHCITQQIPFGRQRERQSKPR